MERSGHLVQESTCGWCIGGSPGGCQNQAENSIRVLRQLLQDGKYKGCCLATSCFRTAQAVPTWADGKAASIESKGHADWYSGHSLISVRNRWVWSTFSIRCAYSSLELLVSRRHWVLLSPGWWLAPTCLRILGLGELQVVCYVTEPMIRKGGQLQGPTYSLDKTWGPNGPMGWGTWEGDKPCRSMEEKGQGFPRFGERLQKLA